MANHAMVRREHLNPEVLAEIARIHLMKRCPLCGGEFTPTDCVPMCGASVYGEDGSCSRSSLCQKCGIVWKLEFNNWNNQGGDGGIRSQYHTVRLSGFANCFCRRSIIGHSPSTLEIHRSDGHSLVGRACEERIQLATAPV